MLVAIKRSSSSSTSIRGGRNARNQIKTESRNEVVVSRMEYKVEESGRREKIPTLEAFGDEIVTIDVDPCRYSLSSSIWRPIFSSTMHLLHPYPSWGCCISGAMLGVSRSTGAERERLCIYLTAVHRNRGIQCLLPRFSLFSSLHRKVHCDIPVRIYGNDEHSSRPLAWKSV